MRRANFYSSDDDLSSREFFVGDTGTLPKVGDVIEAFNLKTDNTVLGVVTVVDKHKMVYRCVPLIDFIGGQHDRDG